MHPGNPERRVVAASFGEPVAERPIRSVPASIRPSRAVGGLAWGGVVRARESSPEVSDVPEPARQEQAPVPSVNPERVVAVDDLQESLPPEERHNAPSDTAPDPVAIGQAIRARRPLYRMFGWISGRVRVRASPEMAPATAPTRRVSQETLAADQAELPPMTWTRLRGRVTSGGASSSSQSDGGQPNRNTTTSRPTRLGEVVSHHRDTDFVVAHVAVGIDEATHDELIAEARQGEVDAGLSEQDPLAKTAEARNRANYTTYDAGRTNGVAHEVIAVGACDPEELEPIAETVARNTGAGEAATRQLSYDVERNPDGTIRTFNSLHDAVTTATGDAAHPVTAEELAGHTELPSEPLPGLGRVDRPTNFDVEREPPTGEPTVRVGEILDNRGRPTGEPLHVNKEHTAVIGATKAGKSKFFEEMISGIQVGNLDQVTEVANAALIEADRRGLSPEATAVFVAEAIESCDHEAVVVLDCKNEHQFTDTVSRQVGGMRGSNGETMPEEMATVTHAMPGGDGPGFRFNLLRPAGDAVASRFWRKRIGMALEVLTAKYKSREPDTYQGVKKWLNNVIVKGCATFRINASTGTCPYPTNDPATPTGEYMVSLVEGAGDDVNLTGDYRNNVIGWVKTELDALFSGDNGAPLAESGYRLDGLKLLNNKGITSVDLANMRDAGSRQVAVLATLFELYDACRAKNLAEGINGSTDKVRVTVFIDEADIFTNDELGASVADFLTHARHAGMRIVWAKQGDIEGSVHKQVWLNSLNKVMFRTGSVPDRAAFAGAAGRTSEADMQCMTGAQKGEFVYIGPGMSRAVRARTRNPHDPEQTPMADQAHVTDVRNLIDLEGDPEPFSQELRREAVAFLHDTEDTLGSQISNWAEVNMIFLAGGKPLTDLRGELFDEVFMRGSDAMEADKIRCAIVEAISNAVNSRPDIQWSGVNRIVYKQHLVRHMLAMARGEYLEGWDQPCPELAIVAAQKAPSRPPGDPDSWRRYDVIVDGKFGMAKEEVARAMTPSLDDRAPRFAAALGHQIAGQTGHEQLDDVIGARNLAINNVARAIETGVGSGSDENVRLGSTVNDLALLLGGVLNTNTDGLSEQDIRTAAELFITGQFAEYADTDLSVGQRQRLRQIIDDMPIEELTRPEGYPSVEAAIRQRNAEHRASASAVNPAVLERLFGGIDETRPEQVELLARLRTATTSAAQEELLERLEQLDIAARPYTRRVKGGSIWYGADTRRAGVTIDNNISILQTEGAGDYLGESVRTKAGYSSRADHTLGAQMTTGDHTEWTRALATFVTYNEGFGFSSTPTRVRWLVKGFGRSILAVKKVLDDLRSADERKGKLKGAASNGTARN